MLQFLKKNPGNICSVNMPMLLQYAVEQLMSKIQSHQINIHPLLYLQLLYILSRILYLC